MCISRATHASLAVAALLLVGCARSESGGAAETAADSVPAVGSHEERPALVPPPDSALSAELRIALEQLLRGASAQPQTGAAHTWFSAATADALRSVAVDSTGLATVDFHDLRPLIPNASSSAGSASLLDELNATVFRFTGIRSVEYRMEGSCDLFWEWLQYGCHRVTRDEPPHGSQAAR